MTLDIMFQGCLVAMLAFLQIYMVDDLVGWHTMSLVAVTASGKGMGLAQSLCVRTWDYLEDETQLPVSNCSNCGKLTWSIIQNEDLAGGNHTGFMHLKSWSQFKRGKNLFDGLRLLFSRFGVVKIKGWVSCSCGSYIKH